MGIDNRRFGVGLYRADDSVFVSVLVRSGVSERVLDRVRGEHIQVAGGQGEASAVHEAATAAGSGHDWKLAGDLGGDNVFRDFFERGPGGLHVARD